MRARIAALVSVLVIVAPAPPVAACGVEEDEPETEVLGWADAGRVFVYRTTRTFSIEGEPWKKEVTLRAVDVLTSQATTFRVVSAVPEDDHDPTWPRPLRMDAASQKQQAGAGAWLKKHPPVAASPARRSPDGKATADVEVQLLEADDRGSWTNGEWAIETGLRDLLRVTRDGVTSLSAVGDSKDVRTYWSPDGRRIVWRLGWGDFVVGPAGGPRIQIAANRKSFASVVAHVREALEAGGFAPTIAAPARQERPASVVYFAEGFEDAAKRVAGLVPGGATIEKLTWKPRADLVVAAGESAAEGVKR